MYRQETAHDRYTHKILTEIEASHTLSQRSLASSLGIALGMTNLLVHRLVRKGWVRVSRVRPNRLAYFLTPKGMAEKAAMSRAYFQDSVRFYASARERVGHQLANIAAAWPESHRVDGKKPIVFLGTGEVAEIAFVCLQETDLHLHGVIDFQERPKFFGVPVYPAAKVEAENLRAIVPVGGALIAFSKTESSLGFLERTGWRVEDVLWIQ